MLLSRAIGGSSHPDGKALLKTIPTELSEHKELVLMSTQSFQPSELSVLIVLEGTPHSTKGEM